MQHECIKPAVFNASMMHSSTCPTLEIKLLFEVSLEAMHQNASFCITF